VCLHAMRVVVVWWVVALVLVLVSKGRKRVAVVFALVSSAVVSLAQVSCRRG